MGNPVDRSATQLTDGSPVTADDEVAAITTQIATAINAAGGIRTEESI